MVKNGALTHSIEEMGALAYERACLGRWEKPVEYGDECGVCCESCRDGDLCVEWRRGGGW